MCLDLCRSTVTSLDFIASFGHVWSVAVTPGGVLLVATRSAIYAVDAGEGSSGLPELLAGQHATTRMGLRDGRGAAAKFNHPRGISLDSAGNVVLADAHNNAIRLISPDGDVATLAGALGIAGHADGPGSAALFNNPTGVACCRDGSILVTDTDNHCIRRVSPVRGFHSASSPPPASAAIEWETETVAGRRDAPGHEDASGTSARFCYPGACALDSGGYLVVADAGNDCIRRVSTDDWQVWTVAGMAGSRGHADGVRAEARFSSPAGIAVDIQGNIFVADRKVRASVHVCVCVCVCGRVVLFLIPRLCLCACRCIALKPKPITESQNSEGGGCGWACQHSLWRCGAGAQ